LRLRFAIATTFIVTLIVIAYGATSGVFEQDTNGYAVINDIAVRRGIDSGYRLIAVDGHDVRRIRGRFVTMVPFALVPPGEHSLTVESKDGNSSKTMLTFVAKLEIGKRYRFELNEDTLSVIEDARL